MDDPCDEHCINFCRLISQPEQVQEIASGAGVQARQFLNRRFGTARWRKLKGLARIETSGGVIRQAEVHWYEAQGVGRRMFKWKRFLD